MIIGTFAKSGNRYVGTIETLAATRSAEIVPVETRANERSPDYRVYAGGLEIGAAWNKTGEQSGKAYVSVSIDDPSFPAAINANLFENDKHPGGARLVWERPKSRDQD